MRLHDRQHDETVCMSAFVVGIAWKVFDDDSHAWVDLIRCRNAVEVFKTACRGVSDQVHRNLVVKQLGPFGLDRIKGSMCVRPGPNMIICFELQLISTFFPQDVPDLVNCPINNKKGTNHRRHGGTVAIYGKAEDTELIRRNHAKKKNTEKQEGAVQGSKINAQRTKHSDNYKTRNNALTPINSHLRERPAGTGGERSTVANGWTFIGDCGPPRDARGWIRTTNRGKRRQIDNGGEQPTMPTPGDPRPAANKQRWVVN